MTSSEVIKNKLVPPLYRKEWSYMIKDYDGDYQFSNYGLQLVNHQIQERFSDGKIVEHQAVIELFKVCVKYHLACNKDLQKIFGTW